MPGRGLPRDQAHGGARLCRQLRAAAAPPQRSAPRPPRPGRSRVRAPATTRSSRCVTRRWAKTITPACAAISPPRSNVRIASDPITRAGSADEVPLQTALALLLREKLTGQPVPAGGAGRGRDGARIRSRSRVGDDFERLAAVARRPEGVPVALARHARASRTDARRGDRPARRPRTATTRTAQDETEDERRRSGQRRAAAAPGSRQRRRRGRRRRRNRAGSPPGRRADRRRHRRRWRGGHDARAPQPPVDRRPRELRLQGLHRRVRRGRRRAATCATRTS